MTVKAFSGTLKQIGKDFHINPKHRITWKIKQTFEDSNKVVTQGPTPITPHLPNLYLDIQKGADILMPIQLNYWADKSRYGLKHGGNRVTLMNFYHKPVTLLVNDQSKEQNFEKVYPHYTPIDYDLKEYNDFIIEGKIGEHSWMQNYLKGSFSLQKAKMTEEDLNNTFIEWQTAWEGGQPVQEHHSDYIKEADKFDREKGQSEAVYELIDDKVFYNGHLIFTKQGDWWDFAPI